MSLETSKSKEGPLIIYWTPGAVEDASAEDWNNTHGHLIYSDPKSLQADLMEEKNPQRGPTTFLSCPAAKKTFKKTFVFYNAMSCSYTYDLTDRSDSKFIPEQERHLNFAVRRAPALMDKPTVDMQLRWLFFSEESINTEITPPMFHRPKYLNYATPVPGEYDIGSWFRPFNFELQLWEPKGRLVFEDNEPIFYITFNTDRDIILKRFVYTNTLSVITRNLINSHHNEPSLEKRYELFNKTSSREIVLKEIKKNLLEG